MKPKPVIVIGLLVAVAVIMYAAAARTPSRDEIVRTIAAVSDLKGRMCACKDRPCAEKVVQDMAAWGQANAGKKLPTPSDEDTRQMTELVTAYSDCMSRLITDAPPSPNNER